MTLTLVTNHLLGPNNLTTNDLNKLLNQLTGNNIDYADIYFENNIAESWSLQDGIVKNGHFFSSCGAGIRAVSDDKTGFSYTNSLQFADLQQATKTATSIIRSQNCNQTIPILKPITAHNLYPQNNPFSQVSHAEKVQFLQQLEQQIRGLDSRIIKVNLYLSAAYKQNLIAAIDGTFAADCRPIVRFSVNLIIEQNGKRESSHSGFGGRADFHYLLNHNMALRHAQTALNRALTLLDAKPAPAGSMPVILANGWSGVLIHEAVGHGLEGDFNRKGESIYSDKIGQQVASNLCTIIDNGTIAGKNGSLNIDDEGTPTQSNILIEDGILRGYMYDKLNAKLMHTQSTGNGRRQSYKDLPLPRMTNTYLLAGKSHPQEIIQSVSKGLYCASLGGGQVDITSGQFVFEAQEAYLIENGKITAPVKGATLIGSGFEVMQNISMVGNDLALDDGIGSCGKDGQTVPVGVGMPTVKISNITVGGST